MNWNTSPDGSGDDYGAERYYYFSETVCLYAFWYQLPTVTLSYDANGGTGPVPETLEVSDWTTITIAAPSADLKREGYEFRYWNTRPDGSGTGYKGNGSDSFTITADTTLYAVWTDSEGSIVPSPGTGESSVLIIFACFAALFSVTAASYAVIRRRVKGNVPD